MLMVHEEYWLQRWIYGGEQQENKERRNLRIKKLDKL